MNKKKVIITVVAVVAVVLLGIKGKGLLKSRQNQIANESLPLVEKITVHVVNPKEGRLVNKESFLAKVASDQSIKLSTKIAGFVEKILVEESDVVKKGQLLVEVDSIELRSNIEALKANLAAQKSDLGVAKSIYERNRKLYRVGGLAKEKLEMSKASLAAKSAMIENTDQKINQANHQLSYLQIKAPFDGVVDALMLQEGDLAAAGKPILSLSNGKKKLLFSYAPSKESNIKKGKMVLLDEEAIGSVKSIYTTSNNGLVTAEIALTQTLSLPVGSSLNVEVLTHEAKGCMVPQDTLLHKKDALFVMVYQEGHFTPFKVKSILSDEKYMIISPCPKAPVAQESEVKLAKLPAYQKVNVIGEKDE